MEVKTFYANTIEAAFALAKREFGSEAMLMQSNRAAPGSDQRGAYEVVFAGEPLALQSRSDVVLPRAASNLAPEREGASNGNWPAHVWKTPGSSLPELVRPTRVPMKEVAFGRIDLVRGQPLTDRLPAPANLKRLNTQTAAGKKSPVDKPFLHVTCNPGLGRFASASYIIALAGPTGSGKTTTAMKLAVQHGLLASRPCRLIAYDPDRVGTAERLRHFSTLLKIPFEALETPAQLSAAITLRTPGFTIIDTAGCGRADDHVLAGLAFLLGSHHEVETQLVLRADRKVASNIEAAARFSALSPKRLIITALDETTDYREVEELAVSAALPLSFLGTGQGIPDDLEPATLGRLEGLVDRAWSRTATAAA